ncbi:MAG: membrane protein insertase YidC, partial [Verrucomicrobiae bacterium]|nr:membrane protein insertase YidC [Verrucomicrobiae bacterium]
MDRKAIVVLLVCFLLLLLSRPLVERIYPPVPAPAVTNAPAATMPGGTSPGAPAAAAASEPSISAPTDAPTTGWLRPEAPEQELAIENDEARYLFTSHGGGLKSVELKDYRATVNCRKNAETNGAAFATLNLHTDVPALALLGGPLMQDNVPYSLRREGDLAVAEKQLTNGLRLVKEFLTSTNHQLEVTLRIQNQTNAAVAVPPLELVIGTASPMQKNEEERFLGLQFYDGNKAQFISQSWFANRFMGCGPSSPRLVYRSEGVSNVVWAAVQNRFFTMIAAPESPAYQVVARQTVLDWPELQQGGGRPRSGYQASLVHPGTVIDPGGVIEWKVTLFAGPKEYNT